MNWKKIKKKYPKVYSCLCDYNKQQYFIERYLPKSKNVRWLYDFFDIHKIYTEVVYAGEDEFCGYLSHIPLIITRKYSSRRKAEDAVFKEAFKVLEGKLTTNINTT